MELPLPPHWDPGRVGDIWRVPYERRAEEAEEWARQHGITPGRDDARRICLVVVDAQNTFCTLGFELFVPGAPDDNRRLCEFVYRNLGAITTIVPTLDTHRTFQIFHAAWLVDADGRHPEPYTLVSAEDIVRGVWRAADSAQQEHLLLYVRSLEAGDRYRLTVWPYHAMLGGIGHALVSAVEEAVFFHGLARASQPGFEIKGDNPLT
jgi:nicotinamidase-related amidase